AGRCAGRRSAPARTTGIGGGAAGRGHFWQSAIRIADTLAVHTTDRGGFTCYDARRPGARMPHSTSRREFVKTAGAAALAASLFPDDLWGQRAARRRYAIVGTGDRGSGMWGRDLVQRYPDALEVVGLCDINPKRAIPARNYIGVSCATFTSIDEMLDTAKPDLLMVTTVDGFHHEYI